MLNDKERRMVESFAKQIDLHNTNGILQYGAGTQKKMADFSEKALENVKTKEGRILVPATLREFAGLEKDVVLTGNLNRIEVWSKAKWSENNDYDDMDAIAEDMQEMGIII